MVRLEAARSLKSLGRARGLTTVPTPKAMYALRYEYAADAATRRAPHRAEHLELARTTPGLLLGGAFHPVSRGAFLIFDSEESAQAFADSDPYGRAKVVESYSIERYDAVAGSLLASLSLAETAAPA